MNSIPSKPIGFTDEHCAPMPVPFSPHHLPLATASSSSPPSEERHLLLQLLRLHHALPQEPLELARR